MFEANNVAENFPSRSCRIQQRTLFPGHEDGDEPNVFWKYVISAAPLLALAASSYGNVCLGILPEIAASPVLDVI